MPTVENNHIGPVFVTPHALERYAERGSQEPLEDVLKRAMPFGGQFAENLLLADGEIVFTVKQTEKGLMATTVLTMDQAIVNMENWLGPRVRSGLPKKATSKAESKPAYAGGLVQESDPNAPIDLRPRMHGKNPKVRNPNVDEVLQRVLAILDSSDEDLAREMKCASGQWSQLVQRESGRRTRNKKQHAHRLTQDRNSKLMVEAMHRLFTAEQVQKVWDKMRELEDIDPLDGEVGNAK